MLSNTEKQGDTMKKADVSKKLNGVNITFSGGVAKQNVVSMVERCQTGRCDCMSDSEKKKIESIEVSGGDGEVELSISGDLNMEAIEKAVAKSPLING